MARKTSYSLRVHNSDKPSVLAPAGPAWAGSLMGTSIAASLTAAHGLPSWLPALFAIIAAGILVTVTVGWVIYRNPHFSHISCLLGACTQWVSWHADPHGLR